MFDPDEGLGARVVVGAGVVGAVVAATVVEGRNRVVADVVVAAVVVVDVVCSFISYEGELEEGTSTDDAVDRFVH